MREVMTGETRTHIYNKEDTWEETKVKFKRKLYGLGKVKNKIKKQIYHCRWRTNDRRTQREIKLITHR